MAAEGAARITLLARTEVRSRGPRRLMRISDAYILPAIASSREISRRSPRQASTLALSPSVLPAQGKLRVAVDAVQSVERFSGSVAYRTCDVTDARQVESTMAGIERDLGPIDVLVCNAGEHSQSTTQHSTRCRPPKTSQRTFASPGQRTLTSPTHRHLPILPP